MILTQEGLVFIERVQYRLGRNWRTFQSLFGTNLYLVPDSGEWIFSWIARYLSQNLDGKRYKIEITHTPLGYRNQLIHFIDRYSCLGGLYRILHRSNRLFMNWFHGEPDSHNANIKQMLEAVPEASNYLEKIVVSTNKASGILQELGISKDKITKIPLGVDLKIFKRFEENRRNELRRQHSIPRGSYCIGCFQKDGIGWEEGDKPKLEKGPDVFLDVVAQLKNKINDLYVILTGPARGYVKNGLDRIGVPYKHRYFENYNDIVDYYNLLDVLLIPSRSEGGPMAFLEAWATGVPVISTRMGMPEEMIRSGENGLLVEIEDVGAMTEAVELLREEKAICNSISEASLREIRNYDWSVVAETYHNALYSKFV